MKPSYELNKTISDFFCFVLAECLAVWVAGWNDWCLFVCFSSRLSVFLLVWPSDGLSVCL